MPATLRSTDGSFQFECGPRPQPRRPATADGAALALHNDDLRPSEKHSVGLRRGSMKATDRTPELARHLDEVNVIADSQATPGFLHGPPNVLGPVQPAPLAAVVGCCVVLHCY